MGRNCADAKRFEMLSLLASVLSWTDIEREKAGLQRAPSSIAPPSSFWSRSSTSAAPKNTELEKTDETEVCCAHILGTKTEARCSLFLVFGSNSSSPRQQQGSPTLRLSHSRRLALQFGQIPHSLVHPPAQPSRDQGRGDWPLSKPQR